MVSIINARLAGVFLACTFINFNIVGAQTDALVSLDTGLTISKVRTAQRAGQTYVVASSYEGTVLGIDYSGKEIWRNAISGFMNRDIWCADLNGNGDDEILIANANGTLYCLDAQGKQLWDFKPNDAPMNAVCVLKQRGGLYVVCGGYDNCIYYLSAQGIKIKTVHSSKYSKENPWGKGPKAIPPKFQHIANFLRPLRLANGEEHLVVHAVINSNSGRGAIYLMKPLQAEAYQYIRLKAGGSVGELHTCDMGGDGNDEILTGASSMIDSAVCLKIDPRDGSQSSVEMKQFRKQMDHFGYRVLQPLLVRDQHQASQVFMLFGTRLVLMPVDMNTTKAEVLATKYSYNDVCWDKTQNKVIMASAQSGGSCIHVLDLDQSAWKKAYQSLNPPGKIATILKNTDQVRQELARFQKPAWERSALPVTFMTESRSGGAAGVIDKLSKEYASPIFLNSKHLPRAEIVDRSNFHPVYQERRDRRKRYELTSDEMAAELIPNFKGYPGISYWGGHGNDPFMTSLETQKKIFDAAQGKQVVTIYPELEQYDKAFAWVMENHLYPLADYAKGKNVKIFIRTKHAFWHSIVYLPMWRGLLSGQYADVFIPALEETTDKTMEQSVAARLGIWTSGAVDHWGARCARDNTSYDRLRQHSHQELPNHFLRQMIYNISCGATYINNFPVDQDYMSLLWELIAKGALYVPKRNELLSLSPVHMGMLPPDKRFLDTGNNAKWVTFYDEQEVKDNPMVFDRLNGTWPGASVTEWDFSFYAAGVKDRRLNYLPPYEHGIVMLAPPQTGIHADKKAPRGKLVDHLHPLYRSILKEYYTDGRSYISADGSKKYAADEYYQQIEKDIQASAKHLPLTVSGDVAWVVAQTSPTHLRLTLIDNGYINPQARTAKVSFHAVRPRKMTDLLDGEELQITNPHTTQVDVPCGLFRFIDIELVDLL